MPDLTTPQTNPHACEKCGAAMTYHAYREAAGCGATIIDLWRCPACGHSEWGDARPADDPSCDLDAAD